MRIALAQQNYLIGDVEGNCQKIIGALREARKQNADLVVFSELSVCGYPPQDLLDVSGFAERCSQGLSSLAAETQGIAAVVGVPLRNTSGRGKAFYNAACLIENGAVHAVRHKSLLPDYDVFDDYRYFEPNDQYGVISWREKKLALTVCEDIWEENPHPMHSVEPLAYLSPADLLINLSASPFEIDKAKKRQTLVTRIARTLQLPVFYCNCVGAQTGLIFDGGSLVVSPAGVVYEELGYFREQLKVFDLQDVQSYAGASRCLQRRDTELLYEALVFGIRDFFAKMKFSQAVVGLSGGIDSAVVACLAAKALGADNVWAVMMPSPFTSPQSRHDAKQLAAALHIRLDELPIHDVFAQMRNILGELFGEDVAGIPEENLQARIRANLLMALCNRINGLLLNTSNKSELATGYGTLYGDLCGALSVLGDVYKTQVYELASFINEQEAVIPPSIVTRPPSAELKPGQLDTDTLPPYDLLDRLLLQHIEGRQGYDDLLAQGFDPDLVRRVLSMVHGSEFKRFQSPPILRVSTCAFGVGRKFPVVYRYPC